MTRRLPFQLLLHRGVGEGTTPFHGLLHFTLDPYLIMLSVKQYDIKYYFWVFGMTRAGIEPQFSGSLVNTLLIRPILYSKEICGWNTRNSCWDLRRPCSVGKYHTEIDLDASKIVIFVDDKECSDAPRKFEDNELEALIHEYSSQAQAELIEAWVFDHTTLSKRLKALGMIQKQGLGVAWTETRLSDFATWQRKAIFCKIRKNIFGNA